jgi:hypothetical protein
MRLLTGLDCAVGVLGERGVRRLALDHANGGPMMGDELLALFGQEAVVAGVVRNQL